MKHKGHLRKMNPETGEIDPKEGWIVNNQFLYSDDGFKSSKSVFGEYNIGRENYWGLLADAVIAGYVESSTIVGGTINIGNGKFIVNSDGSVVMKASSIDGYVTSDELFSVENNLSSRITVTENGIATKVSKDSIISTINQSAESIAINADKISLTGKQIDLTSDNITIDSTNFSVTKEGKITSTSGNIAGWNITNSYIDSTVEGSSKRLFLASASDSSDSWMGARDENGNYVFVLSKTGKLYASNAEIAGKITASSGAIGGWNIESNVLGSEYVSGVADGNRVGIAPGINTTDFSINSVSGLCFWAGASYDADTTDKGKVAISNAPFRVYADGTLHCSNAHIKGRVEATSGSIGGFSLNTYSLDCTKDGKRAIINSNSIGISGNVVFGVYDGSSWTAYIDGAGKLVSSNAVITGNITATSGTIGGCSITDGVLKVPVANISGTITANSISVDNFSASSSGVSIAGWTVDNNSIRTGTLGSSGSMWLVRNGSNLSATIGNRSGSGWCIGINSNFGVTSGGALYCSSGNIGAGMTIGSLSTGTNKIELTTSNVYCWTSGSTRYSGKWHDIVRAGIYWNDNLSSDRRIKNSIETLDSRYETLFDNLNPVRFKFNDGTSGRYHTGFIAQEIKDAMDTANITTEEFACFCIDDEGTEYEKMLVRKDEIIALCVSEIQKLKARTTELEERLAQ